MSPPAMPLACSAMLYRAEFLCNGVIQIWRHAMNEFKETIGHILIMQLLVAAIIVERWSMPGEAE